MPFERAIGAPGHFTGHCVPGHRGVLVQHDLLADLGAGAAALPQSASGLLLWGKTRPVNGLQVHDGTHQWSLL